jgi:CIC family chloride channel protein
VSEQEVSRTSTTEGLPVAPSMGPSLEREHVARRTAAVDARVVAISALAILLALAAGFIAQGLTRLIGLITNLAFYGRISADFVSPAGNQLGAWVVLVPMVGGVIVGLMARYGSQAIRGHGIPEAMEQVLFNQSRIPARMTFLKPLSAAISIGTGGPFGAEGPIIATGGALGSLLGQSIAVTADERKTLLAAGAAAGMAATFGSPVAAVLLAIELLLFEYRPRSIIPVALASATATAVRSAFVGTAPAFAAPSLAPASGGALAGYIAIGAAMGVFSVLVTRSVYAIEDAFERLPLHWMWWPLIGAIPVGVIGYFAPRTMGVGYDNIEQIVGGVLPLRALAVLCACKFASWAVSLGSGTSGGTLAPLFTIGGGLGALLGAASVALLPGLGVDPRLAAMVGMAAMFAGASRALLASAVFVFETTRSTPSLLPLLGGCSAAFLVSCLLMRNSIMTEKIARRGVRVLTEYSVDFLDQCLVREIGLRPVTTLRAEQSLGEVRAFLASALPGASHQGFPVVDGAGALLGVVTRRDLIGADADARCLSDLLRRPAIVVYADSSLREAADMMVRAKIGRLPVVTRDAPADLIGILTRSDLIEAHAARLQQASRAEPSFGWLRPRTAR